MARRWVPVIQESIDCSTYVVFDNAVAVITMLMISAPVHLAQMMVSEPDHHPESRIRLGLLWRNASS